MFKYSIRFYTFILVAFLITLSNIQAQNLSPELGAILQQALPDSIVTVLVRPKGQVDVEKVKRSLETRLASRTEQHKTIIEELKSQSSQSQSGLSEYLEEKLRAGRIAGYRQFWIANLISVTAPVEAIREIALHPDVEEILENKTISLQENESATDSLGKIKEGTASGSLKLPAFKVRELTTPLVITNDSLLALMGSGNEKSGFNAVNPSDSTRKALVPRPILLSSVSAKADSAITKAKSRLFGDKGIDKGLPLSAVDNVVGDKNISQVKSFNKGQTDGEPGEIAHIKGRLINPDQRLDEVEAIQPIPESRKEMEKDSTLILVGKLIRLPEWQNDTISINKSEGMLLTASPSSSPLLSSASVDSSRLRALIGKTEPKAMFEMAFAPEELNAKRKSGESVKLAASPAIYLEYLSYTLGNVAVGSSYTGFFNVYNLGGANLVISSITSSNPAFTVSPTSGTIAPVSYGSVYVTFQPTSSGSQSTTITISSNDPTYPTVLVTVSGNGISPEIELSTTSGSHGNVAVGSSDTKTFTISNTGTADLVVSSITSSNPAFAVSPTSYTILPGYYITVSVTFTPPSAGNYSTTITINSNDIDEGTVTVSISGTGIAPAPEIDYPSTTGDIGNVNVGSSGGIVFNIYNYGTADLVVSSISSNNPAFTLSHSSATILPGYYLAVTVFFSPTSAGNQSTTITISSNDADEGVVSLTVIGNGVVSTSPEIELSTTSGSHGNVNVGSSDTKTFTISNIGNADLVISSIASDNPAFTVTPTTATIPPNYYLTVSVTFSPTVAGSQSARITVNSNDADESTLYVNITGNGIAAAPEIDVSTTSGALGDVAVGSSVSKYFTIFNTGNADLIVNSITSSNPSFTVSPTSSIIHPGYYLEVWITFTPTSAGQQSAIITVSSNDSDEGTLTVTLTGNGVAAMPEISLSTTAGSMGYVYVGSSYTATFIIYNIGTGDLQVSEISSNNTDFSVYPSSTNLPPDWYQIVLVTFTPSKTGLQTATITIRSNDSDEGVSTVTVVGNGIATAPEIALSTTYINIGNTFIGDTTYRLFEIYNLGTADLVVNSISSDNKAFDVYPSSSTIRPGWVQPVGVFFLPIIQGIQSANIRISSNDSDESSLTITAFGNGIIYTPPSGVDVPYSFNWGLERINVKNLWSKGIKGEGVLVGIIDSGVDGQHPTLKDKWSGANGASASASWYDPWNESTYPVDDNGHGSHVMGLIVGQNGNEITGAAPAAKWIAAKGLDSNGSGDYSTLISCWQWMADPDGNPNTSSDVPDVVNYSVGPKPKNAEDLIWYWHCPSDFEKIIDNIISLGVTVFLAAGNEGIRLGMPAGTPDFFAVGAIDESNSRASFSNIGPSMCDNVTIKPDLVAPGVNILSAFAGKRYTYLNGTSMATPLVAGVAALLKQGNPDATPSQIYSVLKNTSTDLGIQGPDNEYGWGLVNAEAAYNLLAGNIELLLSTTSLSIGDVFLGSTGSGSFSITNNGSQDAMVTLNIDNSNFSLDPATVTIPASQSVSVKVTFSPKAAGSQSGVISFSSADSDLSLLKVNVYGNGNQTQPITIAVSSNSLSFEDVNLGESGSGSFTLTNNGTSNFVIKSVTSSNPAFSVDPTSGSIPAGQSLSISVILNSSKLGLDSTVVIVESEDPNVAPITVTVKVTVIGPAWNITSIDPDTLFVGWADQSLTVHGANLPDSGYFILIQPSDGVAFKLLEKSQSSYRLSLSTEKGASIGEYHLIVKDLYDRADTVSFVLITPPAPELTRIFPDTIVQGALDTVTVLGKHLTFNSNVEFSDGGVSVLKVLQDGSSDSALVLVVSSEDYARIGIYNIKVTNPIGDADSLIGVLFVTAGPPVIDSLSIPAFLPGDSLMVIIRGRRLQQGATIIFSDSLNIKAIDYVWKDSSEVSFFAVVSKQAGRGQTDIFSVSNEGSKTLAYKGMAIRNPLIMSIFPPSIPQDTNAISITVTGDDFEGLLLSEIEGNALTIDSMIIQNTSVTTYFLRCDNNYHGKPRFTFTNSYGQKYEAIGVFEVLAVPKVTAVTPDSTSSGQSTVLTIEGANLDSGCVAVVSTPDEVLMTDSKFEGNRLILNLSISDSAATGWRELTLSHLNGVSRKFDNFLFIKGITFIESLSQHKLFTGITGLRIVIKGRGFVEGASLSFSGTGISVNTIKFNSSSSIELVVSIEDSAALGKRDLIYVDIWGKQFTQPEVIEIAAGVKGDASGDGVTNIFDLLTVLKDMSNKNDPSSMSDINQDGKVNVFDLLDLLKLLKK